MPYDKAVKEILGLWSLCHIRLVPCDTNYPQGSASVKPVQGMSGDKWAIDVVCVKTDAGYNMQTVIPADKAFMPDLILAPSRLIGFDIAVDDADRKGGARRAELCGAAKRITPQGRRVLAEYN